MAGLLESVFLVLVRKYWGRAFTNVHEVITYMTSITPIAAVSVFFDSIQTALQGVARGCGWQKLGAFLNLGSYYIVGVPSAVILAFVFHMKGHGLILGVVLALAVQVACFLPPTIRTNWEKEAKKAAIRVGGNRVQVDTLPGNHNVAPSTVEEPSV
ncbi:Multi antimicrobial extrusion protein [Sesbania bispinosa]|nr:Multi antimicrobial extrusion protein [Sesbania bispinosa]